MALTRRRPLRVLVLICTAAVLTGITAAVAADRIAIEPASATQGWCTHYTNPYAQYSSSGWEAQFCYDHQWHYGAFFNTTGVALRDKNAISFGGARQTWQLWYRNGDSSYNCCWAQGVGQQGDILESVGYAQAVCSPTADPAGYPLYCTTWW